ncbi:hypothetical protein FIBSPDRAFT_1044077 [Athelia psychrophila]|uniref:Uncharacterized protein n=1 Tax=Athelia psychrophila TaxID=1759441 RepID=A0A166K526_9AGAM|nr:hypothetical protein FIBSPDRAFT_1044077 [Fibularhizoctonia sp. CBS 109695]
MQSASSSRHTRTMSPPQSQSSHALTAGAQQRVNIVTRVAIEGKAKKNEKGAGVRMYLKMAVPVDSLVAGSTIALFSEESIKILSSQVHPIDSNSVPWNFSSTTSPLLHSAAHALGLPARSSKSYLSLFGHQTPSSSRHNVSINGLIVPTLDDKYTGHILVSGYNVSYVLPKEFPPRFNDDSPSMNALRRRPSITDRGQMHFMAAIDLWVPYVSKPPRAPFLLSIPVPRCLSNNIKLRIFPPSAPSQSFASLSSIDDDPGSWELAADPHVTRSASSRPSRASAYTHTQDADDESSDSSTAGFAEGCGVQGSFPSTDRVRVRWAAPSRSVDVDGDGRRRVGVKEVKGEMNCVVLGKERGPDGEEAGVVVRVEYKGGCKGIWFDGVATLLGMDLGLESKGSDVFWAEGFEKKWEVTGGPGYTGFDTGAPPARPAPSRQLSRDSPEAFLAPHILSRQSSASSQASLLRAPLPATGVGEYSFEGSNASLASEMSSISSSAQATPDANSRPSSPIAEARPPAVPLNIHVNMNDLLPPSKNVFNFTISGTILVVPRRGSSGAASSVQSPTHTAEADPRPIVLPKFTIFTSDSETITTMIRSEANNATVEVYTIAGDIREAQTRRTVLQKGGLARCGMEGGRIGLRSVPSAFSRIKGDTAMVNGNGTPSPRTPTPLPRTPSTSTSLKRVNTTSTAALRPRRDGALMIPSVDITVTPLPSKEAVAGTYAVRVCLPAPADTDKEWFEFGLAQSTASTSAAETSHRPQVDIASASIEGVPVRFETSSFKQDRSRIAGVSMPLVGTVDAEWASWVRVHVGEAGGGRVQVDYVVTSQSASMSVKQKGKQQAGKDVVTHILLPTFQLAVGRLVVNVEADRDYRLSSLKSNFTHQQSAPGGPRLLHYSLDEFFSPKLSMALQPAAPPLSTILPIIAKSLLWAIPTIISLFLLLRVLSLDSRFHQMQHSLDSCPADAGSSRILDAVPEATSSASNSLPSGQPQWWFGEDISLEGRTYMPEAPPAATVEAWSSSTTLSSSTTSTTSTTSTSSPSPASIPTITPTADAQTMSLMPITNYVWPIAFELPEDLQHTMKVVLKGLGVFWQVCRKVYHYPLDPS